MAGDPIELSERQVEMLLFFAGRRAGPCGDTRTTAALLSRGLLTQDAENNICELTELGRDMAARLS